VVVPVEMVIMAGATNSESAAGELTSKVAVPTVRPSQLVAVMVVEPTPTAVALPVLLMVATSVLLLLQVTWLETSKSLELPAANVKWPAAAYCWLAPAASVTREGDTVIELSWSTARGSPVEATPWKLALMFVVPGPTPVANPVALIEATDVLDEVHVVPESFDTSFVVLLLNIAVAVYCKGWQEAVTAGRLTSGRRAAAPRTPPAGAALT